MQEPIRYYITKRGDEPTVRSVKVAQSAPEAEVGETPIADAAAEPKAPDAPLTPRPGPSSGW